MANSFSTLSPWDLQTEDEKKALIDSLNQLNPGLTAPPPPVTRAATPEEMAASFGAVQPAPVPVQPKGSGLSASNSADANQRRGISQTESTFATPEKIAEVTKYLRELPEVTNMQQGQNLNKQLYLSALAQPPQVDLSTPLANLSDFYNNGKLGSRPPSGETAAQHANRIREWAKQTQDDQRDVAKVILEGIGKVKSGMIQDQILQTLALNRKVGSQDPEQKPDNSGAMNYHRWQQDVSKDKVLNTTDPILSAVDKARSLILSNNPVSANNVKVAMSQALGVTGKLSNMLMSNEQTGDKALLASLDQKFENLKDGLLTPENKKYFLDTIDQLERSQVSRHQAHRDMQIKSAVSGYGIPANVASNGVYDYSSRLAELGNRGNYALPNNSTGTPKKSVMEQLNDFWKAEHGGQ